MIKFLNYQIILFFKVNIRLCVLSLLITLKNMIATPAVVSVAINLLIRCYYKIAVSQTKILIELQIHHHLPLYTIPFLIIIYKLNDLARLSTIQLLARNEANVEFATSLRICPGLNVFLRLSNKAFRNC